MQNFVKSYRLKKGKENSSFLFSHYDIIAICIDIYVTWFLIYISELTISTAQFPEDIDFYENLMFLFLDIILLIIKLDIEIFKRKYGILHEVADDYMDYKGITDLFIPTIFIEDGKTFSLLLAIILTATLGKANIQTKKELKTVIQVITISSVFFHICLLRRIR